MLQEVGAAELCAWPNILGDDVMPASVRDPGQAVNSFLAQGGQVVTFDVFDTLLWRRVLFPADAFALLPHRWGRGVRPRVEAVVTAACRRLLRREPRLDDIYRFYPFDAADELQLEARLAVPNPWCLELVRALLGRGVKVAAISDMYLGATHIAALLQSAGYPPLPVFVSSEAGLSKHEGGRLFAHVGERLGAPPARWMHVGDNPHADVAMAQRHGLATCWVQTPRDTLLSVLPGLSSARARGRVSQDPVFLGELAIALHLGLSRTPGAGRDLAPRLTRLLSEARRAGWSAQAVVDAALALSGEGGSP